MPTPTVPRATVLCDSVSPAGVRLTTIEVTLHRFVLAELNTHRVFSRNSASSRAIPVRKQIARVVDDPAIPLEFGADQRGMQAGDPLTGEDHDQALAAWLEARDHAVEAVRQLQELGVHKQVTNRLLEPFMWHTVIVTATEWDGFWQQRCSGLAQPEIRAAAEAMKAAYDASGPRELDHGEWHTPLIRPDEDREFWAAHHQLYATDGDPIPWDSPRGLRRAVSAARCARVSYLTHDGTRDVGRDVELYRRLVSADPPHWSPLEHVATPCGPAPDDHDHRGNLRGWDQLRHAVEAARTAARAR